MTDLDRTHDARATSWVDGADQGDFPIQNLPFASFRPANDSSAFRGGVGIGSQILDLAVLSNCGLMNGPAQVALVAAAQPKLNALLELGPMYWHALRLSLFDLLSSTASAGQRAAVWSCLHPQDKVEFGLPMRIGDFTDFFASYDHALNSARLARPDGDVTPNFRWMPIAYHGRVSSIGVSGQTVRRPMGQRMLPGADKPTFGPSQRLDYELELGVVLGCGNAQGEPVSADVAERMAFGMVLLNDWSARDVQRWESAPLGPFLAKNFATTISPWVVTLEALAPFRSPRPNRPDDPALLAYLDSPMVRQSGAIDIELDVRIRSAQARHADQPGTPVTRTNFRHHYWTIAQMIAHHTVGGCNLVAGDLLGTGTVSGPTAQEAGCLLELTRGGNQSIPIGNDEHRTYLEDGDEVILRGWCERPGFARIGFGECRGRVLASSRA